MIYMAEKIWIAGPCVAESESLCIEVAGKVSELCKLFGFKYIFKASFDKANRTSLQGKRGPGQEEGLRILETVKSQLKIPVITDIHESVQASEVADVADVLQIPAFLCRQTDLLQAAGATGKIVNIKKGQFLAPQDMAFAVEKVKSSGAATVWLTERGTTFGYRDLVVDFRGIPLMQKLGPVIFDATHSIQQPGAGGGKSSGVPEMALPLAKAAAALNVDGIFTETHTNPENAWSDGPNMIPLNQLKDFMEQVLEKW
jgi:2-dehydro-3-deoxyphosphooctonate aldolase (KDO 8-P synthase)